MPAALAPIGAEVTDVCRVVVVGGAAPEAVLRVGGVLERPGARGEGRRFRTGRRCSPPLGERRDERVVGVRDEHGVPGKRCDRGTPALRDVLELAVAVELVAEQVSQFDDARPGTAKDLRQRELVDLEEPELRVARGEQRRRDARREVRARVVPCKATAGERIDAAMAAVVVFPFVAETSATPSGSLPASASSAPGSSFHTSLPGQRRPAAASGGAREPPHEPGGGRFEREPGAHPAERTRAP